ncbi:MAG: hypothetical protein WAV23_03405 [Minisyncoccia bacterium]
MDRKKIYIISIVILSLILLSVGAFYYYKNKNVTTDKQKIDLLDQLSKDAEGSLTDQQKVIILDKVAAPSSSGSASSLTREQKLKLMSGGQ